MNIIAIENRRMSTASLAKKHGNDISVIDLTSLGAEPWVRFSPFYPHGLIPVPFSPVVTGASVEGIWQALKVFETCDIDTKKLAVTNMKGLKRTVRTFGKVLGHRAGVNGEQLLSYLEARKQIYLPCYQWVLENRLGKEIEKLKEVCNVAPLRRLLAIRAICTLSWGSSYARFLASYSEANDYFPWHYCFPVGSSIKLLLVPAEKVCATWKISDEQSIVFISLAHGLLHWKWNACTSIQVG